MLNNVLNLGIHWNFNISQGKCQPRIISTTMISNEMQLAYVFTQLTDLFVSIQEKMHSGVYRDAWHRCETWYVGDVNALAESHW